MSRTSETVTESPRDSGKLSALFSIHQVAARSFPPPSAQQNDMQTDQRKEQNERQWREDDVELSDPLVTNCTNHLCSTTQKSLKAKHNLHVIVFSVIKEWVSAWHLSE